MAGTFQVIKNMLAEAGQSRVEWSTLSLLVLGFAPKL